MNTKLTVQSESASPNFHPTDESGGLTCGQVLCRSESVRLHFNNPEKKKLEIFSIDDDGKKLSEKVSINSLNEIYQYAEKFKDVVAAYR